MRFALLVGGALLLLGCWASETSHAALTHANTSSEGHDTEHEVSEEEIRLLSKEYVQPVSFTFMFMLIVAALLEKARLRCIPESLIVILVGAGLGFALQALKSFPTDVLRHISAPIVNLIFLPLIIFESGWHLRHKDFGAQFVYILVFAVIGTTIAMLVVGALIHATGDYHGIRDRRTAYTFASLISATDPVATLATYSSLKVDPLLNILVFGESTVNDAVAIVVFEILNGDEVYGPPEEVNTVGPWIMAQRISVGIAKKLCGSVLVGVGLAIIYTLVLRFANMRHSTSMEILFIVFTCFFTFSTAEQINMSGIIAVLFCSIFMGIYTKRHLSKEGSALASFFVKELAAWADMCIFLLVGADIVVTTGTSWKFAAWVALFLLVGRAAAVFPCGLFVNGLKKMSSRETGREPLYLSMRHLFMMWHAGLRGGIGLVLVLEMGPWVDIRGGPGTKQTLINTTVTIIVVFLLLFGGSTEMTLRCLKIPVGIECDERYLYDRSLLTCVHKLLRSCDKKVFKPMLLGGSAAVRAGKQGHDEEDSKSDAESLSPAAGEVDRQIHITKHLARGQTWFRRHATCMPEDTESELDGTDSEEH